MKVLRLITIYIALHFATMFVCAQTSLPVTRVDSVLPVGENYQPVDSAFLAEIERIMVEKEKEDEAKRVLTQYEENMLAQEMAFDFTELRPLMSGAVLTYSDWKFNKRKGAFPRKKHDMADYGVALSPLALNWILKAAGVESRSSTPRMLMANAMSLALVAGISTSVKYSVNEKRPDHTDSHSFPSGHTMLAFSAATILHREYGHISPWISVGGYTAATSTQMFRVRHNRHWINDVFVGAGIGITATNLGYYLTDRVLGSSAINRPKFTNADVMRFLKYNTRPSSISLISGTEIGSKTMNADAYEVTPDYTGGKLLVKTSSTLYAGVEASFFITDRFALEASGRAATAKAKVLLPVSPDSPNVSGCDINLYHLVLSAKYSVPVTLDKRLSLRVSCGNRFTESSRMVDVNTGATFLRFPYESKMEVGTGFAYDYISTKKYVAGFSFDYTHTFSPLMPDRCYVSSVMRVLL